MEIINGVEIVSAPSIDNPEIDGGTIDDCIIGGTTPAAGSFTSVDLETYLELAMTTTDSTGVIRKGADGFIHNFQHPTGGGAVPNGQNTFVGIGAGNFTMGATATSVHHGSNNTGIGIATLQANTTGYFNSAIGVDALKNNTLGSNNAAMGMNSLYSITTGNSNSSVGYNAGRYISGGSVANTTGYQSIFLGMSTRALADNDQNEIVIGYNVTGAGSNTTTIGNGSTTNTIIGGVVQGDTINNQMVSKATFDILGLTTDPRFLNLKCEDPGAGTMTDVSSSGHDGTYSGTMTSGDRIKKGMGWSLDFDGVDDCINCGDNADFEFDDSGATPFTIASVVEVVASTGIQTIIAKYDSGTTLREWRLIITALEEARMELYDESAETVPFVESAVLGVGYHTIVVTYDGSGGNDADDGLNMYIDGALDNTDKSGTVGYTAMEPSATAMTIGASLDSAAATLPMKGDSAMVCLDGSEWSAFDVHRFHQLCSGLYSI